MARYSNESKAAILNKLLPPSNMAVVEVAKEEGCRHKPSTISALKPKNQDCPCPVKTPLHSRGQPMRN